MENTRSEEVHIMSQAEFGRFVTDLKRDREMFDEFQKLTGDRPAWFKLAREKGYEFTAEEAVALGKAKTELSDEDLEKVAGGWSITCDTNTINPTISC
jgi:predicted ribosomally synthesized peptide with nif11-like leader